MPKDEARSERERTLDNLMHGVIGLSPNTVAWLNARSVARQMWDAAIDAATRTLLALSERPIPSDRIIGLQEGAEAIAALKGDRNVEQSG